jgi:hypothetical protein
MFDTNQGFEAVGQQFHIAGHPFYSDDFQTVMMIEMNMLGGEYYVIMVVLDI